MNLIDQLFPPIYLPLIHLVLPIVLPMAALFAGASILRFIWK